MYDDIVLDISDEELENQSVLQYEKRVSGSTTSQHGLVARRRMNTIILVSATKSRFRSPHTGNLGSRVDSLSRDPCKPCTRPRIFFSHPHCVHFKARWTYLLYFDVKIYQPSRPNGYAYRLPNRSIRSNHRSSPCSSPISLPNIPIVSYLSSSH